MASNSVGLAKQEFLITDSEISTEHTDHATASALFSDALLTQSALQRSTGWKIGKFCIICTVLCCCTMCEHSSWQQLFPFFTLYHADIMLCFRALCGWGFRPHLHWRQHATPDVTRNATKWSRVQIIIVRVTPCLVRRVYSSTETTRTFASRAASRSVWMNPESNFPANLVNFNRFQSKRPKAFASRS